MNLCPLLALNWQALCSGSVTKQYSYAYNDDNNNNNSGWCTAMAYKQVHTYAGHSKKYTECRGGDNISYLAAKGIWRLG